MHLVRIYVYLVTNHISIYLLACIIVSGPFPAAAACRTAHVLGVTTFPTTTATCIVVAVVVVVVAVVVVVVVIST